MVYRELFPPDRPPVALVTGGNRGIGLEVCRQLAALGLQVLLGSRDLDRGRAAAAELPEPVTAVVLDVTDAASIAALASTLDRLDVLVNNAGRMVAAPAATTTAEQLRPVFEANVFGVASAVAAFLPLLERSPHPRIVNVTSTTASLGLTAAGTDFGGDADHRLAYSTSKTALNMLTVQYARALPDRIKVNSATPGFVATAMNGHRGTRTVQEGARAVVAMATLPDDGPTGAFVNEAGPVPW